eukprot:Protomagalhaensia_sp_Gyna_25__4963@NODE_53_length_6056_cov_78_686222_g40_i0_p4_GENE_NODE_53_length_6056_cov_78_686222_g40_i0NODE_53_length_6056_cov_78_686222_g40_i0_p4_ORF_typecomplete_len214_score17_89_NODE_53_length_6056_cov_78_686222_g40_i07121353
MPRLPIFSHPSMFLISYIWCCTLSRGVASFLFKWWQVDKPDVPDWQQWDTGESLARAFREEENAHMQGAYTSMLTNLPPAFPLTFNDFEFLVDGAVDLAVDVLQRIYRDDSEFQKLYLRCYGYTLCRYMLGPSARFNYEAITCMKRPLLERLLRIVPPPMRPKSCTPDFNRFLRKIEPDGLWNPILNATTTKLRKYATRQATLNSLSGVAPLS